MRFPSGVAPETGVLAIGAHHQPCANVDLSPIVLDRDSGFRLELNPLDLRRSERGSPMLGCPGKCGFLHARMPEPDFRELVDRILSPAIVRDALAVFVLTDTNDLDGPGPLVNVHQSATARLR